MFISRFVSLPQITDIIYVSVGFVTAHYIFFGDFVIDLVVIM